MRRQQQIGLYLMLSRNHSSVRSLINNIFPIEALYVCVNFYTNDTSGIRYQIQFLFSYSHFDLRE